MPMKMMIHGGFLSESANDPETLLQKEQALKKIVTAGHEYLESHTAAEAAAYTVSLLEDHPLFNAGTGSQIQSDGMIRMSAALMDGDTLRMAGVMNIEKVRNPILVAQKLLPLEDKVLGGFGATNFARMHGFDYFDPELPQRREEYEKKKESSRTSTVGCVCLDASGKLAAATSTGGKGFELPGRISDSATVAGTYANRFCAVSMTGIGEDIVNNAMAARIVTRVTDGMSLAVALEKTFAELNAAGGLAGAIAMDRHGNLMFKESAPKIAFASFDGTALHTFS